MKKIIPFILVLCMIVSLCACGAEKKPADADVKTTEITEKVEEKQATKKEEKYMIAAF